MLLSLPVGSTSKIIQIPVFDSSSTTGGMLTGLVYNSAGLTVYYNREGASGAATAITLATATKGTWATGGFIAIDGTNMPGWYELHIPDAALASGAKSVSVHLKGATNMVPVPIIIELTATSNQDSVRGGMTALPNAAAEAAGGLYTRGTGAGQIAQDANGNVRVNLDTIKTQAVTCSGGVTIPAATLASTTNITAATGVVLSGVTHTGAVIPTVTTVTNQLTAAAIATGVWQDATAGDFTVASSIGKSLYTGNVVPGAAGGHFIAGTNAATTITTGLTTTFTGNLTGSVASVTADVGITQAAADKVWSTTTRVLTAGTNIALAKGTGVTGFNDLNAAGVANAVWDEAISGHLGAGSTGLALNSASSAGDPWSTALPGAYGAGTAGKIVGDNINATISSRASQTSVDTIDGIVDAILLDTGTDGVLLQPIEKAYGEAGTAQAGSTSSITLAATASSISNIFIGQKISIYEGTGVNQTRGVSSYNGTSKVLGVARNWEVAPDNTSKYRIEYDFGPKVDSSLNVTVGTNLDKNGYALTGVQTGVTIPTVTTLTNAPSDSSGVTTLLSRASEVRLAELDAANLPTDIAALATQASVNTIDDFLDTEIAAIKAKTDLLPAAPAAVGDIPTATQNADALLNRDMSLVSDTNARSPLNAFRFIRNKWAVAAGTLTVRKEDDTTSAWTATVSTDAAADPIIGNDPA